jgi:hypothetical protein
MPCLAKVPVLCSHTLYRKYCDLELLVIFMPEVIAECPITTGPLVTWINKSFTISYLILIYVNKQSHQIC